MRAFVKHVAANDALHSLRISHAPLRLYDWQHIGQGLRHSGCPLRHIDLCGSRLGDAGLAALGGALEHHTHTLRELRLDGCGLTAASSGWLVRLLQISNMRQNEGRRTTELHTWAGGLRHHDRRRARKHLGMGGAKLLAAEGTAFRNEFAPDAAADAYVAPVGLSTLSLAGNDLGDEGAQALAVHLMQDHWLNELDLRRNGIGHAALSALREAAALRESSETERFMSMPELICRLEGNVEEREQIARLLAHAKQREQQARQQEQQGRRSSITRPASADAAAADAAAAARARPREGWAFAGFEEEAKKRRAGLEHKRKAAAAAAAALEQVHRGARASSAWPAGVRAGAGAAAGAAAGVAAGTGTGGAMLTAEDWNGLVKVSGGPSALLDALESLLADTLAKAL